MTSIHNKAEENKATYNCILDTVETTSSPNAILARSETNENARTERSEPLEEKARRSLSEEDLDNLEDDVDFLLSLDKPVQNNLPKITQTFNTSSASMCSNNGKILEQNYVMSICSVSNPLTFYYILCHNLCFTDSKPKSRNVPAKPLDLEKWLDSVLDD